MKYLKISGYLLLIGCFILLVFANKCNTPESPEKTASSISEKKINQSISPKKDSIPTAKNISSKNVYCRDIALLIAGLKPQGNEDFQTITQTQGWRSYKKTIDYSWEQFHNQKLLSIREWQKKYLENINAQTENLLYPFSGPDFIYANAFVPDAKKYFLFGLEPVGSIPDINELKSDSMYGYQQAMKTSMTALLNFSFFITKQMKKDLNNVKINGTIPLLLFFISRSGYIVSEIKPANIDSSGTISIKEYEHKLTSKIQFSKGVEISFYDPRNASEKKLYYFSSDISNNGLKGNPKLAKFFSALSGTISSFIKSASYHPHKDDFSMIRSIILEKSKYIIQDDSGIPYRYFDNSDWNLYFYGKYTAPIEGFHQWYQAKLLNDFPKQAEPLPFRFGYNRASYLLIASRNSYSRTIFYNPRYSIL
ncbi:MAG: hypothetical protein A2275_12380 [Bacteroidetes bacterium RIFOXYA12_FULL_35_11]|nr:MAG: hypothetical protein A2X01_02435 [Bacteroidetes bacterium GWF2_35_48]OFY77877.1 MAG: hypothetical protein A2275_12380 [Bacteroidetes bacterium RIFOXYA12_FULL_35_11]OFY96023.1 MAG: hypothetical protein A2491_05980 [Bacteroidetes bacterium RIFOXYC12_FULL_35_7]HBX50348.1 hypothetical protein [Bacteroidales bacterium]